MHHDKKNEADCCTKNNRNSPPLWISLLSSRAIVHGVFIIYDVVDANY